jgi:hypothetical protein
MDSNASFAGKVERNVRRDNGFFSSWYSAFRMPGSGAQNPVHRLNGVFARRRFTASSFRFWVLLLWDGLSSSTIGGRPAVLSR